jgi:formate--tetrahydrofolate ligase
MALKMAQVVVTETGFGSDLGAEKFFHIVAPQAGLKVHAVVIVATLRALKYHGGVPKSQMNLPSVAAVGKGLPNLLKHVQNMKKFGPPVVVALNRFEDDTHEEVAFLQEACSAQNISCAVSEVFARGGDGGRELAAVVLENIGSSDGRSTALYQADAPVEAKVETVAREIYGARSVIYQLQARKDLRRIVSLGLSHLPVCIAKTQASFSDDPKKIGLPQDFDLTIREVKISAGAGFLVPVAGDIMLMPGLPERPAALDVDIDADGRISGLS